MPSTKATTDKSPDAYDTAAAPDAIAEPKIAEPAINASDGNVSDGGVSGVAPSQVNPAQARSEESAAPTQPRVRILEQPASAWVIQLIATTSRENLEAIAAKHKLFTHPAVRLAAGGTIHYVLLWDVFPDKLSASAALKALPKPFQDMHPWVRKVDTLQAAMMAATKISPPPAPPENP